jgi:hypothetical protein
MSVRLDADRYANLELELACLKCAAHGLIPLQHLDRVLFCRRCSAIYRVEPLGLVELEQPETEKISVQVRSSSSDWKKHSAVLHRKLGVVMTLRAVAYDLATSKRFLWGFSSGVAILAILVATRVLHTPPPPPPLELPTSLEERAVLAANAVARRDTNLLLRLTEPSQHRALRIWLSHAKGLPEKSAGDAEIKSELLTTAITTASKDRVDARVRLLFPADGTEFVLNEAWVYRGDTWYFQPVRLRSARQTNIPRSPKRG